MFLIHDDQSEARQGRKHRQTRSDEKLNFSSCRGQPASPALESSKPAVQRANTKGGQRSRDTLFELRRQIDFRHQQERLPARVDHACGGGDVDLGLAAAGDTLQQRWPECQRPGDCGVECRALVGIQRWRRRVRAAEDDFHHRLDPSLTSPFSEKPPDARAKLPQFVGGDAFGRMEHTDRAAERGAPLIMLIDETRLASGRQAIRATLPTTTALRERRQHLRKTQANRFLIVSRNKVCQFAEIGRKGRNIGQHLVDRHQSLGRYLAAFDDLDGHTMQASAAKPNDQHTAWIRRQPRGQPIIEQLMRCDRQRDANDGHDQRPGILERRRSP